MATFKFVISEKSKSYQIEKDQNECPVLGKKIGDKISGNFLGLDGYEMEITGGSDKDGFPMRKDVEGLTRKKLLLKASIGLKTDVKGLKRRKTIRGNTISTDIVQINCKITKAGDKKIEEVLGKKE